ncbi:MAG: glycosyltransferase family 2 protein [Acidimicrobiales bacterium]
MTVVICAYSDDRWDDLCAAVASVGAQTLQADRCVIVIDHNPELFRRAFETFPGIEVIVNTEESGLSGARNTGIIHSTGEIVAFLDDDAAAEPEWLEELVRPYLDPSIRGTGGVARADWRGGRPGWFPSEFEWVVGCSYRGLPECVAPIRNPIGAAMSFRRTVFSDVGRFDTEVGRTAAVPLGCEETMLGIRVGRHYGQGSIVQVPSAIVDHKVGAERATVRYLMKRCFSEGISKAAVARKVGRADASSSELQYVRKVLPSGIAAGVARCARGEMDGLKAAGLILLGLFCTVLGYVTGRVGLGRPAARWLARRSKRAMSGDATASCPPGTESTSSEASSCRDHGLSVGQENAVSDDS